MNVIPLDNPYLFEYFGLVLLLLLLFGISFFWKKSQIIRAILGIGLILLPILYFYLILDIHSVNIPYTDDFALLETIAKFQREPDFLEKTKLFFEQVNQHRFAFERAVMLLMVFFTGTINIKLQILLGNLFLLGILYLFYRTIQKEKVSWYYFIPVPYILFNLIYYENAIWGIAALQNTPLIFFAFLTFYGLNRGDTVGWVLGIFMALIATFVSGTGMLAFIIGAIILIFQKRFNLVLVWTAIAAGVILFYFLFDYTFIESDSKSVLAHPIFNSLLMQGFVGNVLYLDSPHPPMTSFYPDMLACVILGFGIGLIFLLWALRFFFITKKSLGNYWFLLGAFLFLLGTGAMFVLSRPSNNYFMLGGNIFSRRYMIFGVVSVVTAYVGLVILAKRIPLFQKGVLFMGMVSFIGLNFYSYFTSLIQLRSQREELQLDAYYFKNYSTFLTTGLKFEDIPFWNHPTRMKELVAMIESDGISNFYASDRFPDANSLLTRTTKNRQPFGSSVDANVGYRIGYFNRPAEYIHFYTSMENGQKPAYFLLASDKYTLLLPAIPKVNSWKDFILTRSYYKNIYHYGQFRTKFPSDIYQVWIVKAASERKTAWEFFNTHKRLVLTDSMRPVTDPTTREYVAPDTL